MKMFIWIDPWRVPYGSSLIVAVAESLEEARDLPVDVANGRLSPWNPPQIKLGEPSRIVDLPTAQAFEYEE